LNEPMGAPNNSTLYRVMDRLYRAVRTVDARHLIFVEDGYKGIEHMPYPKVVGWSNVVLSIHSYTFSAHSEQDHLARLQSLVATVQKNLEARQAPFYLGEFNLEPHGTPATMARYLAALDARGWSWSLWTYKTVMLRGSGLRSMWGLYRNPRPVSEPLNPFTDSAAAFLRKLGQVRTGNLTEYQALAAVLAHASHGTD
jgi:endoglucanase